MSSMIVCVKSGGLRRRWQSLGARVLVQHRELASAPTQQQDAGSKAQRAQQEVRTPAVSLQVPTYCVWGANTGVGKTLISAGLARASVANKVGRRCARALRSTLVRLSAAAQPRPCRRARP